MLSSKRITLPYCEFQDNPLSPPMVQAYTKAETDFRKWHQHKMSKTEVLDTLGNQGLSPEEITSVWENYYRFRIDHRNTRGWLWMGIGGFLGLVSCVLTMLEPLPVLRGVFMYGLTSVAVAMALYGCYLVMEKPGDEEE